MENNNQEYSVISEEFLETSIKNISDGICSRRIDERLESMEPFDGVDIFSDISKLPESCKNELKTPHISKEDEKLLDLFDFKESISIDEIIIALYNVHGIEKKRTWVCSHLNALNKKGHIQKISGKKGVYAKVDK